MKEYPVVFTEDMVRAAMFGMTEFRQVLRLPGSYETHELLGYAGVDLAGRHVLICDPGPNLHLESPFGAPGDRLWVREEWAVKVPDDAGQLASERSASEFIYRADVCLETGGIRDLTSRDAYFPASLMPLAACRHFRIVESVRLERLHDITEAGAVSEGFRGVGAYLAAWEKRHITGPPAATNPWQWVVTSHREPGRLSTI